MFPETHLNEFTKSSPICCLSSTKHIQQFQKHQLVVFVSGVMLPLFLWGSSWNIMIYELSSVFLLINLKPMISKNQSHHIPLHQWEFQILKWRYLPPKYGLIWYSTSILGSWEFPLITFLEKYPYISNYVGYMSRFWTLEIIKRMKNSTQSTLAKQLTPQPIDDVLGFGLVLWNILEWWGRPGENPRHHVESSDSNIRNPEYIP